MLVSPLATLHVIAFGEYMKTSRLFAQWLWPFRQQVSLPFQALVTQGLFQAVRCASGFWPSNIPTGSAVGLLTSPFESSGACSVHSHRLARNESRASTISSSPQACVKQEYPCQQFCFSHSGPAPCLSKDDLSQAPSLDTTTLQTLLMA